MATIENLVSTIIPVHNRAGMLREAVDSVLAQTHRSVEVIISDDGSTDDTPAAARALVDRYPNIVRFVPNPKGGAGPARESGRQIARGEFIQYLDSDDRLLPRKFEVQVAALRAHPECGAAYGFILFRDADGTTRPQPFKLSGEARDTLFPRLLIDRWWNTDCPLFRRSVCDAVGPWTNLRYSQDWEYDARVGALGTKLVHCPEYVCEQRHHDSARQTGHGAWLEPPDQVRFFSLLYAHAKRAGVADDAPEMRHFSRWVFFHARECGMRGDQVAARACFDLAVRAAGTPGADMKTYRRLARVAGWRAAAVLTTALLAASRRGPGRFTMKQSWMQQKKEQG